MNQLNHTIRMLVMLVIVVGFSGCGPTLNSQQDLDLGPNEIRTIMLDPSSVAQDVNVSAKTEGAKIKVFIYLSEDEDVVSRAIILSSASDKILAGKTDSSAIDLKASIPANKEASIQILSADSKAAKVSLSITNWSILA